jgi:hypothetical protein
MITGNDAEANCDELALRSGSPPVSPAISRIPNNASARVGFRFSF